MDVTFTEWHNIRTVCPGCTRFPVHWWAEGGVVPELEDAVESGAGRTGSRRSALWNLGVAQ